MGFGFIGSFIKGLGGGGGGSSSQAAQAILNSIADGAYGTAMDMAGNEGQLLLIAQIGQAGFREATNGYYSSQDDPAGVLSGETDHPEAIEEILGEVGDQIAGEVDEVRDLLNIVEKIE